MTRRLRPALVLVVLIYAACTPRPGPITVAENVVTVQNQTTRDWRNVLVTVNDHFTGGVPTLAAGGRMNGPLDKFQTAFGQKYDVSRQRVFKIVVTATDANGDPVKLEYDPLHR